MTDTGTELEDVEVIGERIRRRIDPNVGIGEVVYSIWTGAAYVEFAPFNPALINSLFDGSTELIEAALAPTVRVSQDIPKTDPQYGRLVEAAIAIAVQVNQMDGLIRALGNDDPLFLPRNNQVTGGELKNLWYKMSYVVTTQEYGAGRGGAVVIYVMTGNATSYINIQTIENYRSSAGEFAINYYLLHELSHTTPEAINFNSIQFGFYNNRMIAAGTPDPTGTQYYVSPEGQLAEQFANAVTLIFGSIVGTSLWLNPPYGYLFPE